MSRDRKIQVGRICGVYGVKGWIRVYAYTEPREAIVRYSPWLVKLGGAWRESEVAEGRRHGKGMVVRLSGCKDREQAMAWVGGEIHIRRSQLPETEAGEYYWSDLIGSSVVTQRGEGLGVVTGMMETGANDVLIVKGERERLIPFLRGHVVKAIDLDTRQIRVDWDPDF